MNGLEASALLMAHFQAGSRLVEPGPERENNCGELGDRVGTIFPMWILFPVSEHRGLRHTCNF